MKEEGKRRKRKEEEGKRKKLRVPRLSNVIAGGTRCQARSLFGAICCRGRRRGSAVRCDARDVPDYSPWHLVGGCPQQLLPIWVANRIAFCGGEVAQLMRLRHAFALRGRLHGREI